jgi:uncharacterized protein YeaO (DUF488 family)
MIKTKSVHSAVDVKNDGLRVLATRFRGRGLPTDRYDLWMASLGPSESLLREYQTGRITWAEFSRRYKSELRLSAALDKRNPTIKNHGQKFTLRLLQLLARQGNVTLLCHCAEAERHCHRHLLARLLATKIA